MVMESETPERTSPPPEAQSSTNASSKLDSISKLIQVVSVVFGVIISVLSFNATRQAEARTKAVEAEARKIELEHYAEQRKVEVQKRQAEAAKPFLELRQKLYLDAVQAAAVLANPDTQSEEDLKKAKKRFRELYVAELSLIEGRGVESGMFALAEAVDPGLIPMTEKQDKAFQLAHALRDSLMQSWGLPKELLGNPDRLKPSNPPSK